MGKSSAPAPSYAGLIAAQQSAAASQQQSALGQQQLAWAQQVYNQNQPAIQASSNADLAAQTQDNAMASNLNNEFTNTVEPMINSYDAAVQNWDTPAQEQQNASEAQANVATQYQQAREASQSQLESFGVDPTSTRYAALDIGTRSQEAAAQAGAGTAAIQNTKLQGLSLQSGAIGQQMGLSTAGATQSGAGTAAGTASANALNGSTTAGSNAMTGASTFFSNANQAQGNATSAINGYNNSAIQSAQVNNAASTGVGTAAGALVGASMPTNGIMGFEDGGDVAPQDGQTPGGAIPMQASPSRGQAIDDVPARLTAGEFVMPKDAVEWLGLKQMYSMVDKSRQERNDNEKNSPVKPQVRHAIPAPATFASRPQQRQAIPA